MSDFARYPSLAGRTVLITGGATGIGKAMAEAFAGQGSRVAVLDKDDAAGKALAGAHADLIFRSGDVTDTPALKATIADAISELGGLSVLIANAADDTRHGLDELTPEAWDRCIAVNLKHQFFAAQAAYPSIAAGGGGAIICLGSISWLSNATEMVGYTTAKAGVHGLVRTLARQLGPSKIRVNALLPGWTMTERQRALWVDEVAEREIAAEQCLPGFVMPDDIARMALFLAADDSAMCTQQCFVVDGGWI
jgi:D-xylose 1-dehydrogenase